MGDRPGPGDQRVLAWQDRRVRQGARGGARGRARPRPHRLTSARDARPVPESVPGQAASRPRPGRYAAGSPAGVEVQHRRDHEQAPPSTAMVSTSAARSAPPGHQRPRREHESQERGQPETGRQHDASQAHAVERQRAPGRPASQGPPPTTSRALARSPRARGRHEGKDRSLPGQEAAAARSAASTTLVSSMAPGSSAPPRRLGLIHPATSATAGRRRRQPWTSRHRPRPG